MKVSAEQRQFMIQLIKQLEETGVEELVFDMNIKNGGDNYVFKYAMSKAAPANN